MKKSVILAASALVLATAACQNTPEEDATVSTDETEVTTGADDGSAATEYEDETPAPSAPDADQNGPSGAGGSTETMQRGGGDEAPDYEPQRSKLIKADPVD